MLSILLALTSLPTPAQADSSCLDRFVGRHVLFAQYSRCDGNVSQTCLKAAQLIVAREGSGASVQILDVNGQTLETAHWKDEGAGEMQNRIECFPHSLSASTANFNNAPTGDEWRVEFDPRGSVKVQRDVYDGSGPRLVRSWYELWYR